MDVASLAAAILSVQQGQFQQAVGASILKSSANQGAAVAQLLEASTASLANLSPGVGQNLDVSA
jgi:putative motility protein YjfB-like